MQNAQFQLDRLNTLVANSALGQNNLPSLSVSTPLVSNASASQAPIIFTNTGRVAPMIVSPSESIPGSTAGMSAVESAADASLANMASANAFLELAATGKQERSHSFSGGTPAGLNQFLGHASPLVVASAQNMPADLLTLSNSASGYNASPLLASGTLGQQSQTQSFEAAISQAISEQAAQQQQIQQQQAMAAQQHAMQQAVAAQQHAVQQAVAAQQHAVQQAVQQLQQQSIMNAMLSEQPCQSLSEALKTDALSMNHPDSFLMTDSSPSPSAAQTSPNTASNILQPQTTLMSDFSPSSLLSTTEAVMHQAAVSGLEKAVDLMSAQQQIQAPAPTAAMEMTSEQVAASQQMIADLVRFESPTREPPLPNLTSADSSSNQPTPTSFLDPLSSSTPTHSASATLFEHLSQDSALSSPTPDLSHRKSISLQTPPITPTVSSLGSKNAVMTPSPLHQMVSANPGMNAGMDLLLSPFDQSIQQAMPTHMAPQSGMIGLHDPTLGQAAGVVDGTNTVLKSEQSEMFEGDPMLIYTGPNDALNPHALSNLGQSFNPDAQALKKQKISEPELNPNRDWSPEEDALLRKSVNYYGPEWSVIAPFLPSRSPESCSVRWHTVVGKKVKGRWTKAEDAALIKAYKEYLEQHGELKDNAAAAWSEIAEKIQGRSGPSCMVRYNESLDPNRKYVYFVKISSHILQTR